MLDFARAWVYYLEMPSIVGKRQGKQTYYYLVESARVEGKPRIVSQQYLGSAEEVMAKLAGQGSGEPVRSQHKRFGDLAAVWSMLERLDVAGVVDAVVPRRADAAASVGTYMALATANRIVDPCSKLAFADWWATTAGPRLVKVSDAALDHRRFWDAMDALSQADLRAIETELGRRMVTEFGLDLSGLVLDMTNFATFIDSGNDRAPIAQRGKAKQKRTDLRLVGLALVVTRDGGMPIVSHAYAGDRPDVTQFATVVEELMAGYRQLVEQVESLTLVYDAGQNSADNHALVEGSEIGFVGSLPPSDHPDLLAVPMSRYRSVDADRFSRSDLRRHHRDRARCHPPRGADPLANAARQAVPRVRPDPGQGPAAAGRTAGTPGPRQDPPRPRRRAGRDRHDPANPAGWARSSPPPSPATPRPTYACPGAPTPAPERVWSNACSANGSCSPTATPGPSPTSSPPTAPNPKWNQGSGR